jgi:hypothetical protein
LEHNNVVTSAPEIARAVGAPLLRTVVEGAERADTRDVFLSESHSSSVGEPGDLVLGVGLGDPGETVDLVRRCAEAGASGLVARVELATHPDVAAAAEQVALPLIGAGEGISWAHLVWLLRGLIDRTAVAGPAAQSGVHDDMFALADAVAAIVDAPVTIEDSRSRVLAYSPGQGETDTARVATIVGRRVPEDVAARYRASGVFRRLARSDEPFVVPEGPDGTRPRLVVPVRSGGEWLGSIWAVVEGPVDDATMADLRKAASVLALHLLRLRAQFDVARRSATERLRAALWQYTPERAASLELPGGGPWRVVALRAPAVDADTSEQLQLWEALVRRHGWAATSALLASPPAAVGAPEPMVYKVALPLGGGHRSGVLSACHGACQRLRLSVIARPDMALAKFPLRSLADATAPKHRGTRWPSNRKRRAATGRKWPRSWVISPRPATSSSRSLPSGNAAVQTAMPARPRRSGATSRTAALR